jgi:alpha,alpha-trehalase
VVAAFNQIGGENATVDQIKQFLSDNFLTAGAEVKQLENISIVDLPWMDNITDVDYQGWAKILNNAWSNLTFTFDYSLLCDNCTTSSIPVDRPFVVPGGRFREFYYW